MWGIRNLPEPACIGSVSRLWPSLADIEPQRSGRRSDRTGAPPAAPCGGRAAYPLLSHQKVCAGKVRLDQTHDGVQASHVEDWEACGKQAWINDLRKDIADYLASAAQVATKREELDALNKLEAPTADPSGSGTMFPNLDAFRLREPDQHMSRTRPQRLP